MKEDGLKQPESAVNNSKEIESDCYASAEEVVAAFEDAYKNINGFHKRLLFFALGKIRQYFHANTFRNLDADDVVQTVIKKILTLRRKWYRNKIPDFVKFVRLSILSHIRNEWKRKDEAETVELLDEGGTLSAESVKEIIKEYAGKDIDENYFMKDIEILIRECSRALEDDVFSSFVFDEICEELNSNIEIAARLQISVCEVENAKKRIRRKLEKLKSIQNLREPKKS